MSYQTQPTPAEVEVPGEEKVMFLARVLCGRSTRGSPRLRKPPADPLHPKNRPFNSTCDSVSNPTMYVVYDSAQSYPEYLISFTLKDW